MSRFVSNVLVGQNISNVSQGCIVQGSSGAPAGSKVLVSNVTLSDGRSFRITNHALYEGFAVVKHFDKPPTSVNCSSERIVIDGKVLAQVRSPRLDTAIDLLSRRIQNSFNAPRALPDTSNDEALARLLSEAPDDDAVEVVSRNVVLGAIRSGGDVHIGDTVVMQSKKAKEPVKRKRAVPVAGTRKKKPGPLALDWAATALAEKHSERDECTVCLSNKRDVASQPCGHVLMCVACAVKCRDAAQQKKEQFQCPECRAKIESAARVYI